MIQLSGKPHDEAKDIPHIDRYAKTDEDRQVFDLIFGVQDRPRLRVAGRPAGGAHQGAARCALGGSEGGTFLAEAAKAKIDIVPHSGEQVAALSGKYSAVSPAVVARAKQAISRN